MNNTIATTFTMANQYSKRPKLATLRAFTKTRAAEKAMIQTQLGIAGNHHWQ